MLEIIPEENITHASSYMPDATIFSELLQHGIEFKKAGLKPIYILDNETKEVFVTSAERIQQTLH